MLRIEQEIDIAAPPPAVFNALVRADQVTRWFSEEAEIDVAQKRYDFWGRFTPESPQREHGRHAILEIEPDRQLAFGWRVKDHDTVVRFTLDPAGARRTRLTLQHDPVPAWRDGEHSFGDYWAATLENLRAHLERGSVGYRHDFAAAHDTEVRLSIDIQAPAEAVFTGLVDPQQLTRYFLEQADFEAELGGAIDFHWGNGIGPYKVLEIDRPRRLSYAWAHPGHEDTVVQWELEESGGSTRLTLVHSGFDAPAHGYWVGWADMVNGLRGMLEGGADWRAVEQRRRDC